MATIHLDGTRLEYVERGAGDPVVLVHGSLGDLRSWEPQMEALSANHHVVAYSRRFHHPNPCDRAPIAYSAAHHAEDLAAVIAGLGLGAVHVVGSSYGAYTALVLAARHPHRVRALVLSEPPLLPLLDGHPRGRALRDRFLEEVWRPTGEALQRGLVEQGLRTFVDGLFGDGSFEGLPPEVSGPLRDNAPEFALEASSPEFWTPFTCDDVRRVTAPTLLMSGADTLEMFQLILDELERCLPNSRRVVFPACNHDVPGTVPQRFNQTVLDFLAEQPGDPLRLS